MGDNQAALPLDDTDWLDQEIARFAHVPFPCARCGHGLRGEGSVDALLPCGECEATCCANCGRIWSSVGPAGVGHDDHGFKGHQTIAEQPRRPVALKGRNSQRGGLDG